MAESYRGLTIRIGGDTTKLTQALHTANQAISGTQGGLKKLSDALKMDPTSIKAAQLQVGAFAENAANAATRLNTLNEAMRQVGNSIPKGATQSVREMADAWDNVNMKASEARDSFNRLTSVLATEYTQLSHVSQTAAQAFGETFSKKWTIDTSIDEVIADFDSLPDAFKKSDKELQKFLDKLDNMQRKYATLSEAASAYERSISSTTDQKIIDKSTEKLAETKREIDELRASYEKLVTRFTGFDGEVFKFDNDNVDLESLRQGLDDIVRSGTQTQEWADEMYVKFESMKRAWIDARDNLNVANQVEGFKDLEAETAKAEAKVKSLVDEMLRLAQTSDVAKGLVTLKQELKEIEAAGANAKTRMQEFISIAANNNANKRATGEGSQTAAMQAYSDAIDAAKMKYDNLMEQLKAYDGTDEWIVKLANSTQSLVGITAQANANFEESATTLKTYEAALNAAHDKMQRIKDANPEDYAGLSSYHEAARQFSVWSEIVDVARSNFDKFNDELEDINKAGEIRTLRGDASAAYETFKDLSEINVKPEVDVSALDGLKKAVDAISNGIFDSKGGDGTSAWNFSKVAEDIQIANTALDEARNKYQALSNAVKDNPTNSDAIVQRTEALNQYADKLNASIAAYRAEIDAIPVDKIDQTALATGNVSEAFSRAKLEVDKVEAAIAQTEAQIKTLTDKRDGIKVVTEKDRADVADYNVRIRELRSRLTELQSQADVALDNLATEDNTRRVDSARTKIQELISELHKLGVEVEGAGNLDATPKIDEAAFMQVADRIAQTIRQMGQEVVQSANEIDSAYRNMRKTVDGTEEQFEELRQTAIDFSQSNFTSADTMLEMQALGGQLGVLTEDLEKFGTIGSNLDIATDMDAEDIALKLGQISNVLQLDINGMQGFADALVRLGNNMPAQESAIMAVAQRFGAVAATANFSGEEVLAWSASIAATGQRSEAAATAISNTVSGIEQAIASGGGTLKQFAAIAGMSADEFEKSWQTGPTEALKAFISGLQTLNESDQSAVAALESMGITGVRQQQTLLALSRTIDSLDKALTISSNAWHGVSDQWGKAGDAAVEAEKKSKGFSGALAIMQNNAQNLAASFGDGLIPFMKAASGVMEVLTDTLNAMPEPVKVIVTALAGVGLSFSTITPMLNMFGKGLGSTIAMFKDTASITDFIAKLTGLEGVFNSAAEGGVNLVSTLGKIGPAILAISAAAVAIGAAISATQQYFEEQELLRKSTEGMTEAVYQYRDAYYSFAEGADGSIQTLQELREQTDSAIESQASLADTMSQKWSDLGSSAGEVDYYAQKITELSEKSKLSTAEQTELAAAVQAFNDLTGLGVEILDNNTGKLSESKDTILETAEAWRKMAVAEAAYEMYKDVVKQRIENQMKLEKAQEAYNKALEASKNVQNQWFDDMRDGSTATNNAAAGLQGYKSEIDQLQGLIDSADDSLDQLWGYMAEGDKVASEMRQALIKAGYSVTEFDNLTKEELAQVAASYDHTVDSIIKAMAKISSAKNSLANGIASELDDTSKAANNARADAYKADASKEYDARKAYLDSIYKETQRSYDAEYRALQRQLDSVYKARQKSYDKEYKALQKSLDGQYKELQKSLDNQYKVQQDAFEKQYNDRKKAYDNEYNALKKSLDERLSALKKANDGKLDALKDANDDAEEAFKKETDAYLKELEKRYKASVANAEKETDTRVKAIDDQIKALEAATQREKDAIERRKENDKIAELRAAVDNAKSRRKRAEAEKELNDYLEEVQAKRNENERKAQIEALKEQQEGVKDELAQRKDTLKEQYEAERDAYKEARQKQLDDLKAANDEDEANLKAKLAAEEEALKLSNENRLAALKEHQTAQLEALKENQTAQLDALKESHAAELEALKENQTAQLEALKESQAAQLEALKQSQQDQLQAKKDSQSVALENLKAAHNKELQEMKAMQDANYKILKDGGSLNNKTFKDTVDGIVASASKMRESAIDNTQKMANNLHNTFFGINTDSKGQMNKTRQDLVAELGSAVPETKHQADLIGSSIHEQLEARRGQIGDSAKGIKGDITEPLGEAASDADTSMNNFMGSIYSAIAGQVASEVIYQSQRLATDIASPLSSLSGEGSIWAYDMLNGFNRSFVDTAWSIIGNVQWLASSIWSYLHFSVPERGPLRTADEWGGDFVDVILEGMQSEQGRLIKQVERMSGAIEEAFDPTLTVDAAYEALDTIGKNRQKAYGAIVESKSEPSISINLNMNLSNVSIRDDSDIERLAKVMSQEMASQAARQLAGRLG